MRSRLLLIVLIAAACLVIMPGIASSIGLTDHELVQLTATPIPTPTAPPCPQATPEAFWVDPVLSSTHRFTQTIRVYIGQGDWASVALETGVFSTTGDISLLHPAEVEISLNPNDVHNLHAYGHVPVVIGPGGCQYGGYTLSSTRDRNGAPLTIIQVSKAIHFPSVYRSSSALTSGD